MRYDTEQVIELGWEDAQFYGFIWENEGKDLRLLLQHASKPISELLSTWTSDLRISLLWSRSAISAAEEPLPRGGPLLTLDMSVHKNDSNRWCVLLDFAHNGTIEFECESIKATSTEPAA